VDALPSDWILVQWLLSYSLWTSYRQGLWRICRWAVMLVAARGAAWRAGLGCLYLLLTVRFWKRWLLQVST
jgi:hypothetical protein